jgi:G3E family GTPase
MTPVTIVTGFLGSGKTTLIGRILRDPGFARTAVIVSEFGEISLDHDLIVAGDDQVLTLSTGCLCCAVQTDLGRTLLDLRQRRAAGTAAFDRVLIETSGLSDPAPILQGLMTDPAGAVVPSVVTLVDVIHGETTLRRHAEARQQVALADRLLLSKTDMGSASDSLLAELAALNPGAPAIPAVIPTLGDLFSAPPIEVLAERLARLPRIAAHAGVDTFTLTRQRPLPALALTLLLQAVAEHCGSRLLRLKGLVAIEEMPGQPAVIHGVRHVVSAPEFLDRWPGQDETTRIVFITTGVPRFFVSRLLDAIEAEVRDATALS